MPGFAASPGSFLDRCYDRPFAVPYPRIEAYAFTSSQPYLRLDPGLVRVGVRVHIGAGAGHVRPGQGRIGCRACRDRAGRAFHRRHQAVNEGALAYLLAKSRRFRRADPGDLEIAAGLCGRRSPMAGAVADPGRAGREFRLRRRRDPACTHHASAGHASPAQVSISPPTSPISSARKSAFPARRRSRLRFPCRNRARRRRPMRYSTPHAARCHSHRRGARHSASMQKQSRCRCTPGICAAMLSARRRSSRTTIR